MRFIVLAVDPSQDFVGNIAAIFQALQAHTYSLGLALLVALLVSLAKQGWLSSKLANALPSKALPYVAVGLSGLGTWAAEVEAGTSWSVAIVDALKIAGAAVFLHQTVVEGMRGGREVIPLAPWHGSASGGGAGSVAGSGSTPPVPPAAKPTVSPRLRSRVALPALGLAILAFASSGCGSFLLSAVPTVPVTPANAAQVSSCETSETVHNVSAISGIVLGAGTAAMGTIGAASSDSGLQKTMATSSIITGVVAAGAAALMSVEAQNYSSSSCNLVLGPLPVASPAASK